LAPILENKKKYFERREVPRYFVLEGKLEAQKGGMIS
jgi:hypothetical protein